MDNTPFGGMNVDSNDTPATAEPRKRNRTGAGRPKDRTSYAGLYTELQSRVRHARHCLEEAAQANNVETCRHLVSIALKTLSEGD